MNAHATLLAVVVLTAVAGCGKFYWSRPGGTLDDFSRDSAACAKLASPAYGIVVEDTYRRCLSERGWTRAQHRKPVSVDAFRGIE